MKKFFILTLAVFSLQACKTAQQRAQSHLKRAIELDPSIIAKQYKDTTIHDTTRFDTTIIRQGKTTQVSLNCDSIINVLNAQIKSGQSIPSMVLFKDSSQTITVLKKGNKLFAKVENATDTIFVNKIIPKTITVRVPGVKVTQYLDRPAYHYFWFWILLCMVIATVYFWITKGTSTKEIYLNATGKVDSQNDKK